MLAKTMKPPSNLIMHKTPKDKMHLNLYLMQRANFADPFLPRKMMIHLNPPMIEAQ
jgi:hypothetical protein